MNSTYSFVQSPNYNAGRVKPISMIVVHFTGSASLESTVKWFQNPKAGVSAHYVIGQDGSVVQMVLEQDTAFHAGKASFNGDPFVNSRSIGIELVNWGDLKKVGEEFFCWPENYTRPYQVSKFGTPHQAVGNTKVNDHEWWAPYPLLQQISCRKLCTEIVKRYPAISPDRIVGHEYVAPDRKNDPGPLFDMAEFRKIVFNAKSIAYVGPPHPADEVGDDQLYKANSDRSGD